MGSGRRYDTPWTLKLCGGCVIGSLGLLYFHSMARDGAPTSARCDLSRHLVDGSAATLAELDLKDCGLHSLPASISQFVSLRKLDLARNLLTTLPRLPPSLQVLLLLSNRFASVPSTISALPELTMLSFKSNRLAEISTPLPRSIEWLILTDNQLRALPKQARPPCSPK